MATQATIPLKFQRAELEERADLGDGGRAALAEARHPVAFVEGLAAAGEARDAVYALALMLPARQAVWWACLAVRLLPDLSARPLDLAAVEAGERWVQSVAASDAEVAGEAAERCRHEGAAAWAATAAHWAGPSIAPRGQQAVAPAPHLAGVAARAALLMVTMEPALAGRIGLADLLDMGLALMRGGNGRDVQGALRERLAAG